MDVILPRGASNYSTHMVSTRGFVSVVIGEVAHPVAAPAVSLVVYTVVISYVATASRSKREGMTNKNREALFDDDDESSSHTNVSLFVE